MSMRNGSPFARSDHWDQMTLSFSHALGASSSSSKHATHVGGEKIRTHGLCMLTPFFFGTCAGTRTSLAPVQNLFEPFSKQISTITRLPSGQNQHRWHFSCCTYCILLTWVCSIGWQASIFGLPPSEITLSACFWWQSLPEVSWQCHAWMHFFGGGQQGQWHSMFLLQSQYCPHFTLSPFAIWCPCSHSVILLQSMAGEFSSWVEAAFVVPQVALACLNTGLDDNSTPPNPELVFRCFSSDLGQLCRVFDFLSMLSS
jgi:hypothetical protein